MENKTLVPLTEDETAIAKLNGQSTDPRIVGFCDDCDNEDDNLHPYKYEQKVYLCEGCHRDRMEDK
jgi:NMD protein affecting ribosome stability and mRNA decay